MLFQALPHSEVPGMAVGHQTAGFATNIWGMDFLFSLSWKTSVQCMFRKIFRHQIWVFPKGFYHDLLLKDDQAHAWFWAFWGPPFFGNTLGLCHRSRNIPDTSLVAEFWYGQSTTVGLSNHGLSSWNQTWKTIHLWWTLIAHQWHD